MPVNIHNTILHKLWIYVNIQIHSLPEVWEFSYSCKYITAVCHCCKLPYKWLFKKYNFLAASGPPFQCRPLGFIRLKPVHYVPLHTTGLWGTVHVTKSILFVFLVTYKLLMHCIVHWFETRPLCRLLASIIVVHCGGGHFLYPYWPSSATVPFLQTSGSMKNVLHHYFFIKMKHFSASFTIVRLGILKHMGFAIETLS